MYKTLVRFLDYFIPDNLKINPTILEKSRLLTISISFFVILGLIYNIFHFILGNYPGGIVIISQSILNLLLLLSFRWIKSLKTITHLFCTFFMIMLVLLIYFSGGITFSVSSWLILIPLFATLIIGASQGWIWFIAIALVITGFYSAEISSFHFPNYLLNNNHPVLYMKFMDGYHLLGLFSSIMMLSQISDWSINKLSVLVEEEKQEINKSKNELEEKNKTLKFLIQESEDKKQLLEEKSGQLQVEIKHSNLARLEIEKKESERRKQQEILEEHQSYLNESVDLILTEINKFAEGDLTIHFNKKSNDAIGKFYLGFNRAIDSVRQMFQHIIKAVDTTDNSFHEIASFINQLSTGITQHSEKTKQIVLSIDELSATAGHNANLSLKTSQAGIENQKIAAIGEEVVIETIKKINDIGEIVDKTASKVEKLGEISLRINEIVEVIEEIASQSNLLALNAAIEAARAGEHGRGFSIVADEVRKLSLKTTSATKEIYEIVNKINFETGESVAMMKNVNQEVNNGITLADKAGNALQKIEKSSGLLVDLVNEIASSSEQQFATVNTISYSLKDISAIVEEAGNGINQVSVSINEMNILTENLRKLVMKFSINSKTYSYTAH